MSYTQYQQYGGNPYENAPDTEAGRGGTNHLAQPNLHQQTSNYSGTSNYSNAGEPGTAAPPSSVLSLQAFLEKVDVVNAKIRDLSSRIQAIATHHQNALASTETTSSQGLERLVTDTQLLNTSIRDEIKRLELDAAKTQDGSKKTKARQSKQLKNDFERNLRDYQQEEVAYRQRYREQIARQLKIVEGDGVTDAQIDQAVDSGLGSEGIFQAALKSNRAGLSSSTLGAVRTRHNELQRIEATLSELAAMFADMAQIVEAQEPVIEHTEQNAIKTAEDVNKGNTEIKQANEHARRRNRLKWWCLLIVVLIVLAVALGVGLGIGLTKKTTTTAAA